MKPCVSQFILYINLVVLITPPNMVKMFPYILGLKNITLSEADTDILK